jgi:phage tail sheath protein FI
VQTIPPSVAAVATAVPAFLGYTADATLQGQPTRITSLLEFEQLFGGSPVTQIDLSVIKRTTEAGALLGVDVTLNGTSLSDPVPTELLHYSVKHYFANGGGPCWIYSLGEHTDPATNALVDYTNGITALEAVDEPTLLVFPGATRLSTTGDHEEVVAAALMSCLRTQDRFTIADVSGALPDGAHDTPGEIDTGFRTEIAPTDPKALQYGAAYWPYLRTRIPWVTNDDNVRILSYIDRVLGNDGIPDDVTTSDLSTAVSGGPVVISNTVVRDGETAVYNAARAFAGAQFITLPPSAAVAGAYATTDRNRGVWKAPANIGLAMVSAPAIAATNDTNDLLNVDPTSGKSVNVIRSFTGRGILIWGARTLAGNDNEFRYVPVRRLTIMIEESIEKAIATFVFESNDAVTWVKVRTMIENFLLVQWRAGALQGEKPQHAFDVQVGLGITMTADDILNGYLRVRVAIAPVRPAEFIVLTFEQKLPSS